MSSGRQDVLLRAMRAPKGVAATLGGRWHDPARLSAGPRPAWAAHPVFVVGSILPWVRGEGKMRVSPVLAFLVASSLYAAGGAAAQMQKKGAEPPKLPALSHQQARDK